MDSHNEDARARSGFDLSCLLSEPDFSLGDDVARYIYDLAQKTHGSGALIHLGIYEWGVTCCLAKAAKTWNGKVLALDVQDKMRDLQDGTSAENEYVIFQRNTKKLGLHNYIDYRCDNEDSVFTNWFGEIDFILVDEHSSNEAVVQKIANWKDFVRIDGVIAFNNANGFGDMDRAIDETLYSDSRFIEIDGVGRIRAFRRHSGNLELILCSGLQSGGTTLVSWCFLQRPDMSGLLDMSTEVIQLMPYLDTPLGWCKITTSCFRWEDVADFFRDQGWVIKPLLVVRDVREAYCSLRTKPYGLNGMTAEDPPLRLRFRRFLRDWEQFRANGWPIIHFESLLAEPVVTLQDCCKQLGIPWYDDMIDWPKPIDSINRVELANMTFRTSLSNEGLQKSIIPKNKSTHLTEISAGDLEWLEKTFFEYNQENNYSLHTASVEFKSVADRPSFFVSKRHTQPSERADFIKRIAHCNAELARCQGHLAAVFESKSWKLTKPLRKTQDFLQRLLGR